MARPQPDSLQRPQGDPQGSPRGRRQDRPGRLDRRPRHAVRAQRRAGDGQVAALRQAAPGRVRPAGAAACRGGSCLAGCRRSRCRPRSGSRCSNRSTSSERFGATPTGTRPAMVASAMQAGLSAAGRQDRPPADRLTRHDRPRPSPPPASAAPSRKRPGLATDPHLVLPLIDGFEQLRFLHDLPERGGTRSGRSVPHRRHPAARRRGQRRPHPRAAPHLALAARHPPPPRPHGRAGRGTGHPADHAGCRSRCRDC